MERKFILERQRAGIEAAKARGIYAGVGRVKSVPDEEIRRRHAAGRGRHRSLKRWGSDAPASTGRWLGSAHKTVREIR